MNKNLLQFSSLLIFISGLFFNNLIFAQAPEKMSYQAVIRNSSNALISNTLVSTKVSIVQGSSNGTVAYSEKHTPTTNLNGLVSFEIGTGLTLFGTFSQVDWSTGPYFVKLETDPTGGSNYTIIGSSELTSIPYALYTDKANNISGVVAIVNGGTGAITVLGAKTNLGLQNVDNTSDLDKPISTAAQTALDLKANIASPSLTGIPLAPTAISGTNTTQIATTAFVADAIANSGSNYLPLTGGTLSGDLYGTTSSFSGNSVVGGELNLNSVIQNRRVVLFDDGSDHEFYGFGINAGTLRYQVPSLGSSHVFYAGSSSTSSNELFRISGNGNVTATGDISGQNLTVSNGTFNGTISGASTASFNGNTSVGGELYLNNLVQNRRIVLYDQGNDHEFYGLGINNGTLRYQVPGNSANHIFYAGTSSTSSDEIFRINGLGGATTSFALNAGSFVKSGGLSSEFLKADGSVDGNTYLQASDVSGNYLPISGGTLTGGLSGTSANFSGNIYGSDNAEFTNNLIVSTGNVTGNGIVLADDGDFVDMNNGYGTFRFSSGIQITDAFRGGNPIITLGSNGYVTSNAFVKSGGSSSEFLKADGSVDGNTYLQASDVSGNYLPISGGTLTGGLSGTSANFSGNIYGSDNAEIANNLIVSAGGATGNGIVLADDGDFVDMNNGYGTFRFSSGLQITDANRGGNPIITLGSNGNITSNAFVKSGGSSSEFLKADGSVDGNTYLQASDVSGQYLPISGGTLTGGLTGTSANFTGNITTGAITFPIADGTTNQLLTTDGAGTLSWATAYAGLTNFTESNYTYSGKTGVKLLATNTATDLDVVFSPKGTGAILAQQPDGTVTGGNNRGSNAVDLQSIRDQATQVASGISSTIGGGFGNTASEYGSTIGGGEHNTASSSYSTVGGGNSNTASGSSSTIGGGASNTASGNFSTIGSGISNTASGIYSTIGGGSHNAASGSLSTIGGGSNNAASGSLSTIAGGAENTALGDLSFAGGASNTAESYGEIVLGTYALTQSGTSGSIVATDRLFAIGNGTSVGSRSSALTVLKNGNATFSGDISGAAYYISTDKVLSNPGSNNIFTGVGSGSSNSTGTYNTYMGSNAAVNATSAGYNVVIGTNTARNLNADYNTVVGAMSVYNTADMTGQFNSVFGSFSGYTLTSGANNTLIGSQNAQQLTTGSYNTVLGQQTGTNLTTGSNNTLLGYYADLSSGSLTNATAIGNGAVVDASDKIQLGNTSVTSVSTSGALTTGAVTYPNTDGTANQVLKTNGSGVAAWTDATPKITDVADEYSAAASQTSFTLTQAPSADTKVKMYVNGIRISNTAYSISGTTLTYIPANNGGYALSSSDRIQFDYFY
jgi:hypothetical protein